MIINNDYKQYIQIPPIFYKNDFVYINNNFAKLIILRNIIFGYG